MRFLLRTPQTVENYGTFHSVETKHEFQPVVGSPTQPLSTIRHHSEKLKMSIEQALATLTAAVEANTAALLKAGGAAAPAAAAPEAEAPKRGRPAKTEAAAPVKSKPAHDRNAVNAALEEVKETHGVEAAKNIISKVGKAAKRADIAEENLTAVYEACKAKMEDADGGDADDDM
jgi:hypothetical protein